VINFVTKPI